MTHFRVHQAVHRLAPDERAATDTGAHRHVDRAVEILGCAPACFAEQRGIDVRVEADGQRERPAEWAHDVGVTPAELRRGRDMTVAWPAAAQLERTKAANAQGVDLGL